MCAILDANIVHEVFGQARPPAGEEFLQRMIQGKIRVAVGGQLRRELAKNGSYMKWAQELIQKGSLLSINDDQVTARTEKLQVSGDFKSNDVHILALAQISGARLLYSNDTDLHQDFKNGQLISKPRGKIYSTHKTRQLTPGHRKLLGNQSLCRSC